MSSSQLIPLPADPLAPSNPPSSALPTPRPMLQQTQYPLPEPIVRRVVDFLMLDTDAVEVRDDGSKKWKQDMVSLSMIDRETRRYAWRKRLEKVNLARCFDLKHDPPVQGQVETRVKYAERYKKAVELIARDMRMAFDGTCATVKTVVYHEASFRSSCGLAQPPSHTLSDAELQLFLLRLWKFAAICASASIVHGIPVCPALLHSNLQFPHVIEISVPQLFYTSERTCYLRELFPSLQTITLTDNKWTTIKDWRNAHKINIDGVRELKIKPNGPYDNMVYMEEGEVDLAAFEEHPFVSAGGVDVVLDLSDGFDSFCLPVDLDYVDLPRLSAAFTPVQPKVLTLDLSVRHHRDVGVAHSFSEGFFSSPICPIRDRIGYQEQRRGICRWVAGIFPSVDVVRIRMRSLEPFAKDCYFTERIRRPQEQLEEDALKKRSACYYVDSSATVSRRGADGVDITFEDKEDTQLIKLMDDQLRSDDYRDMYGEVKCNCGYDYCYEHGCMDWMCDDPDCPGCSGYEMSDEDEMDVDEEAGEAEPAGWRKIS